MIVAYARVSTDGQSLESQLSGLKAAGAEKVFSEKQSGAKTDRRELAKAIASLGQGDVLLVTRLDRLARSTRDLLNVLATIAEKGAGFRSGRAAARAWRAANEYRAAETTTNSRGLMSIAICPVPNGSMPAAMWGIMSRSNRPQVRPIKGPPKSVSLSPSAHARGRQGLRGGGSCFHSLSPRLRRTTV
jgi:hypothetical protein